MEHEVTRQGVVDGFLSSLTIDDELGTGEFAEDIEAFEASNECATRLFAERIEEGTRNGCIPYEFITVHGGVALTPTRVHLQVGSNAETL